MAKRTLALMLIPALAVGGAPPSGFAAAQTVRDGEPTPRACSVYGYRLDRDRDSGLATAGSLAMAVPTAPPPPPSALRREARPQGKVAPPPAIQLPSPSPSQVTVTGSRNSADALGRYAPPFPPRRPNTERYPEAAPNAVKRVAEAPVSTFSIDVDTASYANVRRFLNDGQAPPQDAVRVEELVNYFDYDYPAPTTRDPPFATQVAVAPSPWAKGKQLIHIGIQGYQPARTSEPPLTLVFLVDTSGSMMSADRLPLAKRARNVLVDQLRPQDRVSLVAYAGSAGAVLQPTSGNEKLHIRCAIDYLQSGGSTAGGAGLNLAYGLAQQHFDKDAVNRVILMTDGDFNVGVTDNKRLEDFVADKRKTGVYLSVYGFGRGNYQDERMQVLAQNGNGTAAYVDSFEEAKKLFRDDFTKALFPIADDVKIQVEFNPARVAEYRLIGYETRMLKREDFNNDAIDAGEVNAGASVTALYEITPVGGPRSVDALRYGAAERTAPIPSGELAFLKIRYKLPGAPTSKLIERPIGAAAAYPDLARTPEATRWAVAVAAYGQKLRNDPYLAADFGWDSVVALAQSARGKDESGIRAQFVSLARTAGEVQGRTSLGQLGR